MFIYFFKKKSWMDNSHQLLLPFSPKNGEINGIRRVNYTHTIFIERMFLSWPENNCQAILKQSLEWIIIFHFSISHVLLKSLTNPFIFSIATCVEKMEI